MSKSFKGFKVLPVQLFFIVHTISMAAMEILGWPLMLYGLSQFKIRSLSFEHRKTVWTILTLCLVWLATQLIHIPNSDVSRLISDMPWVLLLWGLFWLFIKMGTNKAISNLDLILWTLPISAVYSIYQMIYGWDFVRNLPVAHVIGVYYRATGFFNMPLTFSYVLGFWGALALGRSVVDKKFTFLNMLAIFSGGICVLTSQTRGGWLAYAAVLILAFIFFSLRQKIYSLLILMIITFGLLQNASFLKRADSIRDVTDKSNSQRFALWQAHLEIFKDHPLVGVGYGQTEKMLPEYYEKIHHPEVQFYSYAHNIYIQALASGGLIGALCLYGIQLFFLWAAWALFRRKDLDNTLRRFAFGSFLAQLYFAIGGMTENNFYDGEVVHSVVLIWALTFATYVGIGHTPQKTLR